MSKRNLRSAVVRREQGGMTATRIRAQWAAMDAGDVAFAAHAPVVTAAGRARALCGRGPRRRPRTGARGVRAVFIWSSDGFGDDGGDAGDGEEEEEPEGDDVEVGEEGDGEADAGAYDDGVLGGGWQKGQPGRGVDMGMGGPDAGKGKSLDDTMSAERGNRLYGALRDNTNGPDDVDRLRVLASDNASDAFRRIVMGILGTIPGDTYEVVITSDRGGVSRLMQSSLSTGYALRNAEFRMILNETMSTAPADHQPTKKDPGPVSAHGAPLEPVGSSSSPTAGPPAPTAPRPPAADTGDDTTVAAGDVADSSSDASGGAGAMGSGLHDLFASEAEPDYLRNVPRRGKVDLSDVKGGVQWWDTNRESKQEISAVDYVAKLEAENELLRERLEATSMHDANSNKLMDFMRTLNPEKIAALQSNLSPDAVDAFKRVINSVLGQLSPSKVQMTYSTSRDYLAQLTFWCLLVGYCLRNLEKQIEMTKIFESVASLAESSSLSEPEA